MIKSRISKRLYKNIFTKCQEYCKRLNNNLGKRVFTFALLEIKFIYLYYVFIGF